MRNFFKVKVTKAIEKMTESHMVCPTKEQHMDMSCLCLFCSNKGGGGGAVCISANRSIKFVQR